ACSGCSTGMGGGGSVLAATTAVASSKSKSASGAQGLIFKSMWSRLLWMLAVDQDEEVQILQRKLGRTQGLMQLGFGSVTAIALAQSITTLSQPQGGHLEVEQDDHGHLAADLPKDNIAPNVLGVVGSAVSVLTLGATSLHMRHLNKKLDARLAVLKTQTDEIVRQLKREGDCPLLHSQLVELVGDEAAHEFLAMMGQEAAHEPRVQPVALLPKPNAAQGENASQMLAPLKLADITTP
ncbi:MAG: hypothetical protein VKK59_07945, partial [Vampirovibrionales bacterium]|nr:hypothetical protein [Vampirovibrionales bacterium]